MIFPQISEIRRKRKELDITQAQLAAESGISQSAIAKIERGTISASYATVVKIFETLERMKNKDLNLMTVGDVASKDVVSVQNTATVHEASELMKKSGYSQLPVFKGDSPVGSISEKAILSQLESGMSMQVLSKKQVQQVMGESYPVISESTNISMVTVMMSNYNAVLVSRKGKIVGMVTSADLLKLV